MIKAGYKKTELGEIPKEWNLLTLSNVATYINGMAFKPSDWKSEGMPIVRIENLNNTEAPFNYFSGSVNNRYLLNNGDILLSWSASLGVYIWNRGKALLNQHIFKVVPVSEINKSYLFWALHKAIEDLSRVTHGSTMKHFQKGELERTKIIVPPLPEQNKIAKILSDTDALIESLDQLITKKKNIKQGLMHELLTRGIGHTRYKDTIIGRIPEEWIVKSLLEISELQRGLSYSGKEKSINKIRDGYLFLTLNSIKEDGGLKSDGWSWIKSDRLKERHFVREGDIVIANTDIGMQRGHILGSPAIVRFTEWYKKNRSVYSHHISRLKLKISTIDISFLFYYLSFIQLLARKYHSGTGVWGLDVSSWANDLLIRLPPSREQKKISEILIVVDKEIQALEQKREKYKMIKTGLMQQLLTGKVRVK